mmetsp:Transcript_20385/g.37090  ORF Transcript_20385/g.37090 Transcript_20385/m.37090 type:complete len:367 (-) Transcript_20385:61-1161(-)
MVAAEATEATPLKGTSSSDGVSRYVLKVLLSASLYIVASAGLINYNKHVMTTVFPYAAHLVACHMIFGSACSGILYLVAPSWFPSMSDPQEKEEMKVREVMGRVLPISILYAISLIFSNVAYMFASVSFLQMMKQGNLVFMYILSLVVGIEYLATRKVALIVFIACCTCMTVQGEINFSWAGFTVQLVSQTSEALRIMMQSLMLSGAMKLDVLTYGLFTMPMCALVLLFVLAINHASEGKVFGGTMPEPDLAAFTANLGVLLPNFFLAFLLNIFTSFTIKVTSPLALMLTGVVKDMSIVLVAVVVMSEVISRQQVAGFIMQVAGILTWGLMKLYPKEFEQGFVAGFMHVLNQRERDSTCEEKLANP